MRDTRWGTEALISERARMRERAQKKATTMRIREAIWRRCLASASRKDRRMAQVMGSAARELLLRRRWGL